MAFFAGRGRRAGVGHINRGRRLGAWCHMALWLALAVALVGCSNTTDEAGSTRETDLSESQFRSELVNITLPSPFIDALGLEVTDPSIAWKLEALLQQEVEACMQERGWPYEAHVSVWQVGTSWLPSLSREEFASIHGFGSRLQPQDTTAGEVLAQNPLQSYIDELSTDERASYMSDLWGDSVSGKLGCDEIGSSSFLGGLGEALFSVADQVLERLLAHEDHIRATARYRQCTEDRGLSWLDDPFTPYASGIEGARQRTLTLRQEVDAALSELECRYPWEHDVRPLQHAIEMEFVAANRELMSDAREYLSRN